MISNETGGYMLHDCNRRKLALVILRSPIGKKGGGASTSDETKMAWRGCDEKILVMPLKYVMVVAMLSRTRKVTRLIWERIEA